MPILSKQNNSLAGCPFERDNGRGGIRTHGGFPHARFRVECLKPDSATLPRRKMNVESAYAKSFGVASAERPTSNVQRKYHADDPVCGMP